VIVRVTVCELPDAGEPSFAPSWSALAEHVRRERSDLVLLPEMPFSPWFARDRPFRETVWRDAVRAHEHWCGRLHELGAPVVALSAPRDDGARRVNVGVIWQHPGRLEDAHVKSYLPDEPGYWEASWYHAGPARFAPRPTPAGTVGFLICTDLWSLGDAQRLGKAGVQLLLVPRVTPRATLDKWQAGGRTAGVVAGAYSLSSNRSDGGDGLFGGMGWIADPDGTVLATTSAVAPFQTVAIELAVADESKGTYPRYALPEPPTG
jgi:N-carbamoylputrescine amidase